MRIDVMGKPEGCKLLRIAADVDLDAPGGPLLLSISIHGDFFAVPEETFDLLVASVKNLRLKELPEVFEQALARQSVQTAGISGAGIRDLLLRRIDELSIQTS